MIGAKSQDARQRPAGYLRVDRATGRTRRFHRPRHSHRRVAMIDGDEADDKIIAVLESDVSYGHIGDIADPPPELIDRLKHYFLSYKQLPQEESPRAKIAEVYDHRGASEVILRRIEDYRATYGAPEMRIAELRRLLTCNA